MTKDGKGREVFSVAFDLITTDKDMLYDLYINSSGAEGREHFVKIFPKGQKLSKADVKRFQEKYHYLYISEDERNLFLKSLMSSNDVQEVTKAKVMKESAIHHLSELFVPDREFTSEFLEQTIDDCKESVEAMVEIVKDKSIDEIKDLISSLSFHDFYTFDHSVNVSMYCIGIAKALKPDISQDVITLVGLGGLLHDLGKINVPSGIINNPGKLSDEEFNEIKKHPKGGNDLLHEHELNVEGVDLNIIARMMFEHHEAFDGSGYPNKLSGKDIHLFARVTAIADFFDAITTQRSYHRALSAEEAIGVMSNSAGTKLDPNIFKVFTKSVLTATKNAEIKKSSKHLTDEFDASRPYNVLPIEVDTNYLQKDIFGKKKAE